MSNVWRYSRNVAIAHFDAPSAGKKAVDLFDWTLGSMPGHSNRAARRRLDFGMLPPSNSGRSRCCHG